MPLLSSGGKIRDKNKMEHKQIHLDKSGKMIDLLDMGDWMAENNSEEATV